MDDNLYRGRMYGPIRTKCDMEIQNVTKEDVGV
jgi:hypothetical protein